MRLHHFFVETKIGDTTRLSLTDQRLLHQWRHVLRLKVGSSVVLCDGSGYFFVSTIILLSPQHAECEIISRELSVSRALRELWLFQSLIKKDNFEWVLEKGTELGVSHFVPVLSERSEKKNFSHTRADTIVREAAEQSERPALPVIHNVLTLSDALREIKGSPIVLHTSGISMKRMTGEIRSVVSLFVGPEGGWGENDLFLFHSKHISEVALGPMTLRAETAAIAGSALLLLF